MIDCLRVGGAAEAEARPQGLEGRGVLGRAEVEVSAEEQWRVAGPLGSRFGSAQDILRGEVGPVVSRVQVGDAELAGAAPDARKSHRPPLRPPGVDRQLAPLHDPAVPVRLMLALGA